MIDEVQAAEVALVLGSSRTWCSLAISESTPNVEFLVALDSQFSLVLPQYNCTQDRAFDVHLFSVPIFGCES